MILTGDLDVTKVEHHSPDVNVFELAARPVLDIIDDSIRQRFSTEVDLMVNLAIVSPILRMAMRELVRHNALFSIAPASDVISIEGNGLVATKLTEYQCQKYIHAGQVAVTGVPQPILVATDASQRNGRKHAGFAWVRHDGAFFTGMVEGMDIGDAELVAILAAVKAHRGAQCTLIVRSDSQYAIRLAQEAVQGHIAAPTRAGRSLQRSLMYMGDRPEVRFEWVKGHSGDVMNDTADRLAVMQRRNDEAGISGAENFKRLESVVQENLHDLANAIEDNYPTMKSPAHLPNTSSPERTVNHRHTKEQPMSANVITVYSKTPCVQCDATYRAMDAKGMEYNVVDITKDDKAMAMVQERGFQSAPVVIAQDEATGLEMAWSGFRPDAIADLEKQLQLVAA
ncbi:RNase H family protein [Jonesiaceae bacterium BS-20]|uniref:RNase H family protein n=1 Tax=Jonesiaceae bacterium BS-20 TaxID=3120821 RepID=A0AAU7E078_9MICO